MNNYNERLQKYVDENFEGTGLKLKEVKENEKHVFGYFYSNEPYDIPVVVIDKETGDIKSEIIPPFTNDEGAKTIWINKQFTNFGRK